MANFSTDRLPQSKFRYDKKEFAQRGQEIYDTQVRP